VKIKDYKQIIEDIKNKVYYPIYFLYGEEPYFIDLISDYIENNILSEAEKEFNFSILYGKDSNVQDIISILKRFPMMANYQIVILREAQYLDKFEELESYFNNPLKTTIFVICYKYKKLDGRLKIARTLEKNAIYFESAKLYDNQITKWVEEYLKDKKINITPSANILLVEFIGNNLHNIANELDKLILNLKEGEQITDEIIERNIGISKDFSVFELQKTLAARNKFKSLRIVFHFSSNIKENPIPKVVPILLDFFIKVMITKKILKNNININDKELSNQINIPFMFVKDYKIGAKNYSEIQLKQIFKLLREYDLKSKGVSNTDIYADDGELMKELIFKILNA